ncbi:MAG: acyltransferase domain-containing protein [Clostridium sp.]
MLSKATEVYNTHKSQIDNYKISITNEDIIEFSKAINMDPSTIDELVKLNDYILSTKDSLNIMKTYLALYFTEDRGGLKGYFNISSLIPNNPDLFFLLVAVYRGCEVYTLYNDKGIDKSIYLATMRDISVWANNHYTQTGNIGLSELHWLYYHLSFKLFRIGRLQFMRVEFNGDVKLFKQLATGFPLIMSYGDIKYNFLGNKTVENQDFVSTYIESDITITANPIREGKCLKDPLTINKCDYSLEIANGTPLLDIHIPQGEPLNVAQSIDSMKKAVVFFYKHFNGWAVKGFTCKSWILNPSYKYILKEDSNIRKFASMFYHYPVIETDDQMYLRVFNGESNLSLLKDSPNLTSLQKSIIEGLNNGYDFNDAAIIFPCYDMKKLLHYTM